MSELEKIKEVAVRAAEAAGEIQKRHFGKAKIVALKSIHDLVTEADLECEKKIIEIVKENFPEHGFIAEESGESGKDAEWKWIIDPVDGTTNFSIGNHFFCVSIGVAKGNELMAGVIYAPMYDEMYVAVKGGGAFLNGKKISVSGRGELKESVVSYCNDHTERNMIRAGKPLAEFSMKCVAVRKFGSSELQFANVAAGKYECTFIYGTTPWDVAAGTILVREAGGKITDFEGNEWKPWGEEMVATNGKIHNEVLEIIRKHDGK